MLLLLSVHKIPENFHNLRFFILNQYAYVKKFTYKLKSNKNKTNKQSQRKKKKKDNNKTKKIRHKKKNEATHTRTSKTIKQGTKQQYKKNKQQIKTKREIPSLISSISLLS